MVSMKLSGTCSQVPTASKSFFVILVSSTVADDAVTKTEAPLRTKAGVFGITRIILASFGSNCTKEKYVMGFTPKTVFQLA